MKYRRLLRYLLLILSLSTLAGLWMERTAVLERAIQVLSLQLSTVLGEHVTIQEISLNPLLMEAELTGLLVQSNDDAFSAPFLQIASITLELAQLPSSEQLHIERLRVVAPRIRVDLANGRLVHFPGLQALLDAPPADPTPTPEPPPTLRIEQVAIEDAQLELVDVPRGLSVSLRGLSLDARALTPIPGPLRLTLLEGDFAYGTLRDHIEGLSLKADLSTVPARIDEVRVAVPGASVQLIGSAYVGDPPPDTPRVALAATGEVSLPVLNRYLPGEVPEFFGTVRLDAQATLDPGFRAEGALELSQVALDPWHRGASSTLVVGDGSLRFVVDPDGVRASEILLKKGGGALKLDAMLGFSDTLPLTVTGELQQVGLGPLLADLTLPGAWTHMTASGTLLAKGTLMDPLLLKGEVALTGTDARLTAGPWDQSGPDDLVFSLPSLDLAARFRVDEQAVTLSGASLLTPGSKLFLDGDILLAGGLELTFDAVELDLGELSPLSGFSLGGRGWANGKVQGAFSDLTIAAHASLFGAHFLDYDLGDLETTFLAPLDPKSYLRRLEASRQGGREGPELFYAIPGLSETLVGLEGLSRDHFQGRLYDLGPPMLLMPDFRTRLGQTRVEGPVAVVFADPYPLLLDLDIDPGSRSTDAPPNGSLKELLGIFRIAWDGNPLDARVRGSIALHGPPSSLSGDGAFELKDGTAWGQAIESGSLSLAFDQGAIVASPLTLTLPKRPGQGNTKEKPGGSSALPEASSSSGSSSAASSAGRELDAGGSAEVDGPSLLTFSGRLEVDDRIQARLVLEDVAAGRISALESSGLEGLFGGELRAEGTLDAPILSGKIQLTHARYAGAPAQDSTLELATARENLHLTGSLLGGKGQLDADVQLTGSQGFDGKLSLEDLALEPFLFPAPEPGQPPQTQLSLSSVVKARGSLSGERPLELDLTSKDIRLLHKGLKLESSGSSFMAYREGALQIPAFRLEGTETSLLLRGRVDSEATADLEVSGNFNLALLDALVPDTFQEISGQLLLGEHGRLKVKPLRLVGKLDALELEGMLGMRQGMVRLLAFPPTLDQLDADVRLSGSEVQLERLTGFLGGGPLTGSGTLTLGAGYLPSQYDLEVSGTEAFMRYPSFLPPGLMDLSMRLSGPADELLLSGDVWLKRMVYRERYNWEAALADFRDRQLEDFEGVEEVGEDPLFNLDIRIHAPGTFFLRNNIGNIQLKGELALRGDTNVMGLFGDVETVRGTVNVLDHDFDITKGRFEFTGDYYNPRLDIRMQTVIQSYTIFYDVLGTLSDWQLIPGSDAGLSERDINSLLAFRTLADNITEGNEARSVAAPTLEFLIGRLGLLEQLQGFTMLDRFTLTPATDESGNLSARVLAEKELIQNKLFFTGYYDLSLTGSQDFQGDLEWRALDRLSLIFRVDNNNESVGPLAVSPSVRLKLKVEYE